MLTYISDIKNLPFFEICHVYGQSLERSTSEGFWQEKHGLYHELQSFITERKGILALWRTEQGIESILRMEKYNDGYLIQSLETCPESRRKGFAFCLMTAVLEDCPSGTLLYSHVKKNNIASMHLHLKCGFQILTDMARLLDGTVSNRYATLCYIKK